MIYFEAQCLELQFTNPLFSLIVLIHHYGFFLLHECAFMLGLLHNIILWVHKRFREQKHDTRAGAFKLHKASKYLKSEFIKYTAG